MFLPSLTCQSTFQGSATAAPEIFGAPKFGQIFALRQTVWECNGWQMFALICWHVCMYVRIDQLGANRQNGAQTQDVDNLWSEIFAQSCPSSAVVGTRNSLYCYCNTVPVKY